MTLKLKFSKNPRQFFGGTRYSTGKFYYMGREEACLWIKRDVVDMSSLQAANLTDEAIAENKKNLGEGHALSFVEVVTALKEFATP
jgi:hypothetical protein